MAAPEIDKNSGLSLHARQPTWYGDKAPSFSHPLDWVKHKIKEAVDEARDLAENQKNHHKNRAFKRNVSLIVAAVALAAMILVIAIAMPVLAKAILVLGFLALLIGSAAYGCFNYKVAQELKEILAKKGFEV
jgi:hypothetical protein